MDELINCICEYEALNSLAEPWVQKPPLLVSHNQRRWIVVAPNRKNLRGRFVEHVGFWSPRHGVTLQRQIVLNVPRIKYWISCGAVPSARIQKICSIWNILPKPWYQQSRNQSTQEPPRSWQPNSSPRASGPIKTA